MFTLGTIGLLMVQGFTGFDRPQTASILTLLSNGVSTRDQVLQQGAVPLLQAKITGVLESAADAVIFRDLHHTKDAVNFTDGNGNVTSVRVYDLAIKDFTDYYEFDATLLEAAPDESTPNTTTIAALGVGGWTQATRPNLVYHAGHTYAGAVGTNGDVKVVEFDHATGLPGTPIVLHAALQEDLHAAPALLVDAVTHKLVIAYSAHDGPQVYLRRSVNSLDTDPTLAGGFAAEQTLHASLGGSGDYTYMQLVQLTGEANSPIYLFYRDFIGGTQTGKWAYSKSVDSGATWSAQTVVISRTGHWAYAWIWSNGVNRIDMATTDGAPFIDVDDKTYHLYYEAGAWHATDGTVLGATPLLPSAATLAFAPTAGDAQWPWQGGYDGSGNPVFVLQVIYGDGTNSLRQARWTGAAWVTREITVVDVDPLSVGSVTNVGPDAGFSPGVCQDPDDVNTVFVAEKVGTVFEIAKYTTSNAGVTWTRTGITFGSTYTNRYPVCPGGAGFDVAFLTGPFVAYNDYSLSIDAATG